MTDETATVLDATDDHDEAVAAAASALRDGLLAVVPTDTVYGVTGDAFNPTATAAIFAAKRRQRRFPLPVLIRSPKQLMGLVTEVPVTAERLMAAYWPGPLTLVVATDPNLAWDLGHNEGTVAVRMPMDDIMLDLIRSVGPLAATSANLSGNAAATTVGLAKAQLGDAVAVYLDGGRRVETQPSTIVDITRLEPAILREGPLPAEEVLAVARGELEPHLASAPAPRHKPVSPGGPADVMPDADEPDADEPSGQATTSSIAASAVAIDHRAAASSTSPSRRRSTRRGVGSTSATPPVGEAPTEDLPLADEHPASDADVAADDDVAPEETPPAPGHPDTEDHRDAPPTSTSPPRGRASHHIARDHRADP